MRIAFIVQRYGTEILGGSEYHCRLVAERIAERHQVEVLTTCARDYTTWKNDYPEGTDRIRGVTVRRFANAKTRDLASFNEYSDWIFHHRHTRQDEMTWLERQGPWCPSLVEYLQKHHGNYDVLVFFTYLYAPTVLGIQIAPSKSLLVPTAHDEHAIRLGLYEDVFASAAGMIWNTEAERQFVSGRFHLRTAVEDVVGCGVDLPEGEAARHAATDKTDVVADGREPLPEHLEGPANAFRRRHRMHAPFILYGGRIDPGKGCEELLQYFQAYVKDGGSANLMLMGAKLMPLPDDPHVRFAGILPDQERLAALEAASVVVVPSPHESLSLLALEAFAVGTPVLVNARSEVLVDHCRRSNAGLYYGGKWEFVEALRLLVRDADLRAAMGRNGKAYIHRYYRWPTILEKYERMFSRLRGPQAQRTGRGDERRSQHDGRGRGDRRPGSGRRPGGEQRSGDPQRSGGSRRGGNQPRGRGDRRGGKQTGSDDNARGGSQQRSRDDRRPRGSGRSRRRRR